MLNFPALFDKHYDQIAAYVARRVVDRSTAEDIAQETFVKAVDSQDTYDHRKGSPQVWLFGIANNLMRNRFRSEQRGLRRTAELPRGNSSL